MNGRRFPALGLLMVLVAAGALAGCGADAMTDDTDLSAALDGRTFESTTVTQNGAPLPLAEDSAITLAFGDGQLSANAGCNTMAGPVTFEGDVMRAGPLATTMMACEQALMDQDTWLATLLSSDVTVSVAGLSLTLTQGDTVMSLEEEATTAAPLVGTKWLLDTIVDDTREAASSVPAGVRSTLVFSGGGQVRVNNGCSPGVGTFEAGEDTLTFGPIAVELLPKECPEPSASVARSVTKVLDGPVSYTIEGSMLTLRKGETELRYQATKTVGAG